MKVYSVIKVDVIEGDETVSVLGTYSDRKKAQRKFNSEVKKEKAENKNYDQSNPAFDDFVDEEDDFCIWKDGYFMEDHTTISIHETTLK